MKFFTYGLIDPRNSRVFYVGQTNSVRDRLRQHHRCDPANASYATVWDIRDAGLWLRFCTFGEFDSRFMAMRLERALVLNLSGLTNSRTHGLLSDTKWPISWVDRVMLARAMDPFPPVREYPDLIAVHGPVKPMAHKPGSYELSGVAPG